MNIAPSAGQTPSHITNRTGWRLLTLDSPTNQVSSPVLTSLLHNENIEIARSSAIPNPLHLSTPTTPLPSTTHPPLPEDSTVYDDDEYTTPAPTVGRLEYNREAEEYGRGEEGRKEEEGRGRVTDNEIIIAQDASSSPPPPPCCRCHGVKLRHGGTYHCEPILGSSQDSSIARCPCVAKGGCTENCWSNTCHWIHLAKPRGAEQEAEDKDNEINIRRKSLRGAATKRQTASDVEYELALSVTGGAVGTKEDFKQILAAEKTVGKGRKQRIGGEKVHTLLKVKRGRAEKGDGGLGVGTSETGDHEDAGNNAHPNIAPMTIEHVNVDNEEEEIHPPQKARKREAGRTIERYLSEQFDMVDSVDENKILDAQSEKEDREKAKQQRKEKTTHGEKEKEKEDKPAAAHTSPTANAAPAQPIRKMITKWGDVTDDTPVEDIWTGVDLTATAAAARSSSHTSTPTSSTPAPSARLLTVTNPTLRGNDTDLASRQAANRANKERDKQGKKAKQAERESEMERELFEVIREQQEMIKRQEDWMKRQDDAWKRQRQKQQEAHDDLARRVSELMAYGREQEDETARQQARIAGLEAEVKELRERSPSPVSRAAPVTQSRQPLISQNHESAAIAKQNVRSTTTAPGLATQPRSYAAAASKLVIPVVKIAAKLNGTEKKADSGVVMEDEKEAKDQQDTSTIPPHSMHVRLTCFGQPAAWEARNGNTVGRTILNWVLFHTIQAYRGWDRPAQDELLEKTYEDITRVEILPANSSRAENNARVVWKTEAALTKCLEQSKSCPGLLTLWRKTGFLQLFELSVSPLPITSILSTEAMQKAVEREAELAVLKIRPTPAAAAQQRDQREQTEQTQQQQQPVGPAVPASSEASNAAAVVESPASNTTPAIQQQVASVPAPAQSAGGVGAEGGSSKDESGWMQSGKRNRRRESQRGNRERKDTTPKMDQASEMINIMNMVATNLATVTTQLASLVPRAAQSTSMPPPSQTFPHPPTQQQA